MALTEAEKLIMQQEIIDNPLLHGAGAKRAAQVLNAIGSAIDEDLYAISSTPRMIKKSTIMAKLSEASSALVITFLSSGTDKANQFKQYLEWSGDEVDATDDYMRTAFTLLESAGHVTEAERDKFLRYGEVRASRAQELFGANVTMEDMIEFIGDMLAQYEVE